jgi:hypothetical protein
MRLCSNYIPPQFDEIAFCDAGYHWTDPGLALVSTLTSTECVWRLPISSIALTSYGAICQIKKSPPVSFKIN